MKEFISKKIKVSHGIGIIFAASFLMFLGILFTNIDLILGAGSGDADTLDGMDWAGDECNGADCNIKDYIDSKSEPCSDDNAGDCYVAQTAKSTLDADLIPGNIKSGVTIFGVSGSASCVTLKDNGQSCTAGNECQSGNCYVDQDADRYAPTSGTKICRADSQLSGTDCNDSDASIHNLLSCYSDGDSDGYGAGTATQVCASSCTSGKVANDSDCCNTDARAKPGQTNVYTSANNCGSYDYNCSGSSDKDTQTCKVPNGCSMSGSCGLCASSYSTMNISSAWANCGTTNNISTSATVSYYDANSCSGLTSTTWYLSWGYTWNACEGDNPPYSTGPNGGTSCSLNAGSSQTCACN